MNHSHFSAGRACDRSFNQPPTDYVAIGLVLKCDTILVALRKSNAFLGGLWEFPGGKRMARESYKECVTREVREETGLNIKPVLELTPIRHDYIDRRVVLQPYVCAVVSGDASNLKSDEIRWVPISQLSSLPMPDANKDIIRILETTDYSPLL